MAKKEAVKARGKIQKKAGGKKPVSKSKRKVQSKAAKVQIDKLNADAIGFDEIRASLLEKGNKKPHVLDAKELKSDLKKEAETKVRNKAVENDIAKQLEMITGMEL